MEAFPVLMEELHYAYKFGSIKEMTALNMY